MYNKGYDQEELELMLDSVCKDYQKLSEVTNPWDPAMGDSFKGINSKGTVFIVTYGKWKDKNGRMCYSHSKIRARQQPDTPNKIRARLAEIGKGEDNLENSNHGLGI